MEFTTFIGVMGALLVLVAFVCNQLGKWRDDYLVYDLVNFLGSLLLVVYASLLLSWPFLILNLVWMGLSVRDLFTDFKRNSRREVKSFISKWLK